MRFLQGILHVIHTTYTTHHVANGGHLALGVERTKQAALECCPFHWDGSLWKQQAVASQSKANNVHSICKTGVKKGSNQTQHRSHVFQTSNRLQLMEVCENV